MIGICYRFYPRYREIFQGVSIIGVMIRAVVITTKKG